MGENFKKALAQSFMVLGDRALRARMEPTLFSDRPEVMLVDHTFMATSMPPAAGTVLTFECVDGGVRALVGITEVGRKDGLDLYDSTSTRRCQRLVASQLGK
jgi:hypothetical protein